MLSGDLEKRQQEIERLVGDGDLEGAFNRLLDFINDFLPKREIRHQAIVVKGNWRNTADANLYQKITREKYREERSSLSFQVLGLLTDVVDRVAQERPAK
jgi:hypothetical protein